MDEISVLLIDDEEAFVTTLEERLELRGLTPRVALNGQDALALMEQEPPDVVVLDLRMPGMSGTEVLKRIRAQWPGMPVIMLSGHGSDQDFESCVNLGASVFHKKPLDIDVLLESIRSLVQGQKPSQ